MAFSLSLCSPSIVDIFLKPDSFSSSLSPSLKFSSGRRSGALSNGRRTRRLGWFSVPSALLDELNLVAGGNFSAPVVPWWGGHILSSIEVEIGAFECMEEFSLLAS